MYDAAARCHIYGRLEADDEPSPHASAHHRHGRWYSHLFPEGEWGHRHAATFDGLLSAEQWARAQALGWPASCEGLGLIASLRERG